MNGKTFDGGSTSQKKKSKKKSKKKIKTRKGDKGNGEGDLRSWGQ